MLLLKLLGPIILFIIGIAQFTLDYNSTLKTEKYLKIIKYGLLSFMFVLVILSIVIIVQDNSQTNKTVNYLEKLEQQANDNMILAQEREALAIANRERIEKRLIGMEDMLNPFVDISNSKYPNQNNEIALKSLVKELTEVKKTIKSISISENTIKSISVEARLTCTLKKGEELPPKEVNFMPVSDAHSYFEGFNSVRVDFKSPVIFKNLNDNKITIINNFSLLPGSTLENEPIEYLKNFHTLSVPIITVVYGKSFEKIILLEISITINGKQYWYNSWKYNDHFEVGPRFSIPLEEFHTSLLPAR